LDLFVKYFAITGGQTTSSKRHLSLSKKKGNNSKYIFVQDLPAPMAGCFPDDLPATSAAKLGRCGQRLPQGIKVS